MRIHTKLVFCTFTCACIVGLVFGIIFAPSIYDLSIDILHTTTNTIEVFLEQILEFTLGIISGNPKSSYSVKWSKEHNYWVRCKLDIDKDCKVFIQVPELIELVSFIKDVVFMVLIGATLGYICSRI